MGRYVKGPPIRGRSLYDIYAKSQHPEYRGGKPFDQYGNFIKKYQSDQPEKIERSPESKPGDYKLERQEYRVEEKNDSAETNNISKVEAEKIEPKQEATHEQLEQFYERYIDQPMFKKQEWRDRDGRIEGGAY